MSGTRRYQREISVHRLRPNESREGPLLWESCLLAPASVQWTRPALKRDTGTCLLGTASG